MAAWIQLPTCSTPKLDKACLRISLQLGKVMGISLFSCICLSTIPVKLHSHQEALLVAISRDLLGRCAKAAIVNAKTF